MSTEAAKRAIAALLLNIPTTREGAVSTESLFTRLRDEGHKETDLEAGLFELRTEELIRVEERVEVFDPPRSILHDMPDEVFLTPLPKPEPIRSSYRVTWPLPALQEWWGRNSGNRGITEGAVAQTNHRYTMGELIRELEGAEVAFVANSRTADRVEAKQGSGAALWWRMQTSALRFQPDPTRMPGIDRIEVLCDELASGTGLTAANVRQLRARLCRQKLCTLQDADNCSLIEAADALEAASPPQPEPSIPPNRPAEFARDAVTDDGEPEAMPNGVAEPDLDPTTPLPWLQVASDVPDLGKADTLPEFWEWCNRHREGLRRFRGRLGEPEPALVATAEFRIVPEIVHQCRHYLIGFGADEIPERFAFPSLPRDQVATKLGFFSPMEAFLDWAAGYRRAPAHGIMKLIGDVEEFLTWAMAWCRQRQETHDKQDRQDGDPLTTTPPAEQWLFAPSGNGYFIAGFGESGHLARYKGLADIARLIRTPGKPVPMLDLIGADLKSKNDRRSRQPAVDGPGLQKILAQLDEHRADLEKAQAANSSVEADVAQAEIEKLESTLAAVMGKQGKARDLNNLVDQLRPRIHARIKAVVKAMRQGPLPMPKLAQHFELSIGSESGAFVYRPAEAPPWQFQLPPHQRDGGS
jgi:hypothetical protein